MERRPAIVREGTGRGQLEGWGRTLQEVGKVREGWSMEVMANTV